MSQSNFQVYNFWTGRIMFLCICQVLRLGSKWEFWYKEARCSPSVWCNSQQFCRSAIGLQLSEE